MNRVTTLLVWKQLWNGWFVNVKLRDYKLSFHPICRRRNITRNMHQDQRLSLKNHQSRLLSFNLLIIRQLILNWTMHAIVVWWILSGYRMYTEGLTHDTSAEVGCRGCTFDSQSQSMVQLTCTMILIVKIFS